MFMSLPQKYLTISKFKLVGKRSINSSLVTIVYYLFHAIKKGHTSLFDVPFYNVLK